MKKPRDSGLADRNKSDQPTIRIGQLRCQKVEGAEPGMIEIVHNACRRTRHMEGNHPAANFRPPLHKRHERRLAQEESGLSLGTAKRPRPQNLVEANGPLYVEAVDRIAQTPYRKDVSEGISKRSINAERTIETPLLQARDRRNEIPNQERPMLGSRIISLSFLNETKCRHPSQPKQEPLSPLVHAFHQGRLTSQRFVECARLVPISKEELDERLPLITLFHENLLRTTCVAVEKVAESGSFVDPCPGVANPPKIWAR